MKQFALTIKPHWAYSIFHLGKDIENRSWALPEKYEGQRVWIRSGKTSTKKELSEFYDFLDEIEILHSPYGMVNFPRGAIVGFVEFSVMPYHLARETKWHMEDHNAWKISNAVLLPEPIPAKGKLGFWDCTNLVEAHYD